MQQKAITLILAAAFGLFLRPLAFAQTARVDGSRLSANDLFAGSWQLQGAATAIPDRNCPILQFVFAPTTVTVRCSNPDASAGDVTPGDVYQIESAYSATTHPGSFQRVLVMAGGRILEFHDMEGGKVVRIRWYEVSEDGQTIIATTRPSSPPRFYRKRN